jgi:twitching motility protein PilT
MVDRRQLKELREATWASSAELRAFIDGVGKIGKRDVEAILEALTAADLDKTGPHHRNRCTAFKMLCAESADPSLFAPLAQALPRADTVLRQAIASVLPRVNDVERHGVLCAALGTPDREARALIAQLMTALAGPSALRELEKLVATPTYAGRTEALDVMVPKARHRALDLALAVLRAGTPAERAHALAHLASPAIATGALDAVIAAALGAIDQNTDSRVVSAAVQTFVAHSDEDRVLETFEPRLAQPNVSPEIVAALGRVPRAASMLAARALTGPVPVQMAALTALGAIGNDVALRGLVAALEREDGALRRTAAETLIELGKSGRADVAGVMLALLSSQHPHVRRVAAHLASSVRDATPELTLRMLEALKSESWWIRERVLDAIVELALPELAAGLVRYLEDLSPTIRRCAVFGLLRLRDPETLGAILRTVVADPDWWVREQAVQACGELADPRAIPYLQALVRERPDLRVPALEALMALGASEVLIGLAELTSDEDASVRLAILEILGALDARDTGFYVQVCAADTDPRVGKIARSLLERWKIASASEGSAAAGLLDRLLVACAQKGGDDLILSPTRPPYMKHLGSITPISKGLLTAEELARMILPVLSPVQRAALADGHDVDLSYDLPGFGLRYRVNVFRQLVGLSAVFRRISQHVPKIDDLGLPPIVKSFADYPNGLVLVGGPTGSGKSTTLAALIDYINSHLGRHIVTIEDPIEVLHVQRESLINQREVGTHAVSFAAALRATLRQDPDVILVGELRDRETIEFAVNAAETGHLVFGTVHTTSAASTLDRLIHACEPARQPVIRSMVAESLRAVLCQQLVRRGDDSSRRVVACEILLNNDAVRNLVRRDSSFQLPSVMVTHASTGMRLMDDDLMRLTRDGVVAPADALLKALDKSAFSAFIESLSAPPRPSVPASGGPS